ALRVQRRSSRRNLLFLGGIVLDEPVNQLAIPIQDLWAAEVATAELVGLRGNLCVGDVHALLERSDCGCRRLPILCHRLSRGWWRSPPHLSEVTLSEIGCRIRQEFSRLAGRGFQ